MPDAPPKPCNKCRVLVYDGTERCDKHKIKPWSNKKETKHKRLVGRKLQHIRQQVFREQPFCNGFYCAGSKVKTMVEVLDHIVALSQGGTNDRENLQGLCKRCHDKKTAQESMAGRLAATNYF